MLPAHADPGYAAGDDHSDGAPDPLHLALRSDAAVQSIRACPLEPGGVVVFSHRVMHWGSRGNPQCSVARISFSFGATDPSFEPPYLRDAPERFPRPRIRSALISAQLINYHERFQFGAPLLRTFAAVFRKEREHFSAGYVQKTAAELKAACADREWGGVGSAGGNLSDEDAMEDALDAMLDAQLDADDNLFDDYSEMISQGDG